MQHKRYGWSKRLHYTELSSFQTWLLCNTTASRPIQSKKRQYFSKRSNTSGVSLILWTCSACYMVSLRLAGCHDLLSVSCTDQASQELSSSTSSNRFPASLGFPWASWLGREWPCPQHHHLNLCHNIINPSALIKLHENYHHHMISHNIINLFSAPIKLLKNFQNRVLQKNHRTSAILCCHYCTQVSQTTNASFLVSLIACLVVSKDDKFEEGGL